MDYPDPVLFLFAAFAQDCLPADDCDGDGYTFATGDCDEDDPAVNPGVLEDCTNELDDDCDGLFNEGCEAASRQGALWGGGLCEGQAAPEGAAAFLLLLPLWGRRRRSASGPPTKPRCS